MTTTTISKPVHVAAYVQRAESAHRAWTKQTTATNSRIAHVSAKRAQGLRKSVIDSNMRYTELVNLASDWAWGLHQSGADVPSVSARVPQARQAQALLNLAKDADWLQKLVLSEAKTANLRNTGDDYNADWLIAHDVRWGVAILHTVKSRMIKAGLIK